MLRKAFFIFFISSCGFCHSHVAEPQLFYEAEKTFGMAAKAPLQLDPTPAVSPNVREEDDTREKEFTPGAAEYSALQVTDSATRNTGDNVGSDITEALLKPLEGILSCFDFTGALPLVKEGILSVVDTVAHIKPTDQTPGDGKWLKSTGNTLGDLMLSLMRYWSDETNNAIK